MKNHQILECYKKSDKKYTTDFIVGFKGHEFVIRDAEFYGVGIKGEIVQDSNLGFSGVLLFDLKNSLLIEERTNVHGRSFFFDGEPDWWMAV